MYILIGSAGVLPGVLSLGVLTPVVGVAAPACVVTTGVLPGTGVVRKAVEDKGYILFKHLGSFLFYTNTIMEGTYQQPPHSSFLLVDFFLECL